MTDSFKLTVSHYFRYLYGGVLGCFVACALYPDLIAYIKDLDVASAALVALAFGVLLYMLYRPTIGWAFDQIHLHEHRRDECIFAYLEDTFKVGKRECITAFRVLRDSALEENALSSLEIGHAEIHVLYLTFTLCLAPAVILFLRHDPMWKPVLLLGLMSVFFGYRRDLSLCKEERFRTEILRDKYGEKLDALLRPLSQRGVPQQPRGKLSATKSRSSADLSKIHEPRRTSATGSQGFLPLVGRFSEGCWNILQGFLSRISQLVTLVAMNFSLPMFLITLGCLILLLWNHRAPQAPAWIATSLSIACGGGISLLAIRDRISNDRYIVGMALFFVVVPAIVGCWATLRAESYETRLTFATLIDTKKGAITSGHSGITGLDAYHTQIRELINSRLELQDSGKQLPVEERLNQIHGLTSSMHLADALMLNQIGLIFTRDWRVKVIRDNVMQINALQVQPLRPRRAGRIWRRADLIKVFPRNPFINEMPVEFQFVLPHRMRIYTDSIEGWPDHALIFEDGYCKIRFEPRGRIGSRPPVQDGVNSDLMWSNLDIDIQVTFFGWRVGTQGTVERKQWVQTLLEQLRTPTAIPLWLATSPE